MNVTRRFPALRMAVGFFAVAIGFGLLAGPAAGQKSKEKEPDPKPATPDAGPSELRVFPLRHARAEEARMTLASLLGADRRDANIRIISNERTNEILIYAPAAEMAWIKDLIPKLDAPAAEGDAGKLTVFHLKHVEPDQALEKALRLIFGQGGNFSIDPQRKAVIVYADRKSMDAAEALLTNLEDQAGRRTVGDVQVRVVWLVNGPAKDEALALPDDLKEVLPGLAKMGIDRPRLAAQTLVNVTPNSEFQAKGVAKLESPCQFSVTGMYGGQPDAAALRITIRATRETAVAAPGFERGARSSDLCNLQTLVTAPLGHLVVLGMTPTENLTSVFVVQVLRPDAKKPGQ